jgi:dTDP-4-dehydrorhamnose 3,5-epimerase
VAVHIRQDSATFGKWKAVELSAANGRQLFIPRGFAHGFLALEDNTIFGYKCDNYYDKASERGFRFDDPEVGIAWPEIDGGYVLSPKDEVHPSFREACGAIGR